MRVLQWFRRRSSDELRTLDERTLEAILLAFEVRYLEATGERLPSFELYERYRAGDLDDPFTTTWATYYAAFERMRGVPSAVRPRKNGGSPPPWVHEIVDEVRPPAPVC